MEGPINNPVPEPQPINPVPTPVQAPSPIVQPPAPTGAPILPPTPEITKAPINKLSGFVGMPKFDGGPKEDRPVTPSIKTFKSDVAETVQRDHISVVKMALAENRKREESSAFDEASSPVSKKNLGWIISSIVLVLVAVGSVGYFYMRSATPPGTVPTAPIQTDVIFSESKKDISIKGLTKKSLVALINAEREVQLPLGSIEKIHIASTTSIKASQFLNALYVRMSNELIRSLDTDFFLGLHAFTTNEPLLILTVNNHETAYAGMLAWEKNMKDDIADIFVKPRQIVTPEVIASSTGTSTPPVNATPIPTPTEVFTFQDKIIENKDARALVGSDGKILFFYSFVNKETLVFTTNSYTLKEILVRLNKPKLVH